LTSARYVVITWSRPARSRANASGKAAVDYRHHRPSARDDAGGGRDAEQQRHLTDARARLRHGRDQHPGLLDPQFTFDEHIQGVDGFTVDEQHIARLQ
jgi:hypothetical protein